MPYPGIPAVRSQFPVQRPGRGEVGFPPPFLASLSSSSLVDSHCSRVGGWASIRIEGKERMDVTIPLARCWGSAWVARLRFEAGRGREGYGWMKPTFALGAYFLFFFGSGGPGFKPQLEVWSLVAMQAM